MKWISLSSAVLVTFTFAACQPADDTQFEAEGTMEEAVVPDQQRQATLQSIDSKLSEFEQDITELEEQAQATGIEANVQEEIQSDIVEAREDIQEITTRRTDLEQATSLDQYDDARAEIWEDIRDVDEQLTEARLEAAQDLETYRSILQEERDELDQEISALESESAGLAESERAEFDRDLTTLRERRTTLDEAWTDLESATEENWQDLRTNINQAWRDVKSAFYDVRIPEINAPNVDVPDINAPDINAPDIDAPDVDVNTDGPDADADAEPGPQQ